MTLHFNMFNQVWEISRELSTGKNLKSMVYSLGDFIYR